jgi:hypothetical protein
MAVKVYFAPAPLQYQSEIEMQTYQPIWVEITNTIFGLEDFSITFRKANADDSSNNVTQESISKELDFYDGAYTFIHEQLVTQRREFIYVKLVNECEGCEPLLHFGVIKRKNLKSCDCDEAYRAQINGISRDEIIKARLESILAYNNDSVQNAENCLFELVQERLNRNGLDNEYGIPAVHVRSIFDSITSLLNIGAYSSIFYEYNAMMNWTGDDYSPTVTPQGQNIYNPYYYTTVAYKPLTNVLQKTASQVSNYKAGQGNQFNIAPENRLTWSMFRFLNNLADVFNANWRVKNGVLEFERKDFFYLNANQWLDLSEFKACYSIKDFGDWGYLDISYGGNKMEVDSTLFDNTMAQFFIQAPLNQIGGFIWNQHLIYQDDIIDWFDGLSFTQKSGLIKKFEFGYHPILRWTVPSKLGLKDGMTNLPLLIIKRQNSAINRAFPWGGTGVITHQPMAVSKLDLNGGIMKETLYDNFHFIDDPLQRPNSKGYFSKGAQFFYEFEKNNIPFTCENFANFDINKTIMTKKGSAIMDEVEFNWSKKTMNIKGRV